MLAPTGIDPFARRLLPLQVFDRARAWVDLRGSALLPVAKASVAAAIAAVVASAATLLVLPMVGTPRGEGDSILAGVVLAA